MTEDNKKNKTAVKAKAIRVTSIKAKKEASQDRELSVAKKAKIAHAKKFILNRSANTDRTNMIKVVQYKSAIRRDKRQTAVLKSLGLHSGANSVNYLPNTEKVLTQIKAVSHLVRVFKD